MNHSTLDLFVEQIKPTTTSEWNSEILDRFQRKLYQISQNMNIILALSQTRSSVSSTNLMEATGITNRSSLLGRLENLRVHNIVIKLGYTYRLNRDEMKDVQRLLDVINVKLPITI